MANAKMSLKAAVDKTMSESANVRAVNVLPVMKDGHPVADVTLVKGTEWKTVSEKLD